MPSKAGTTTLELIHSTIDAKPEWRIVGDVRTILDAQCTETSLNICRPNYSIGGAAVSTDAESSIDTLGEFISINGRPIWTPAKTESSAPSIEAKHSTVYTPFLFDWDGTTNATYFFHNDSGISLLSLFQQLLSSSLTLRRLPGANMIVSLIVGETVTSKIVDKVMKLAPSKTNKPANNLQIIHPENMGNFFAQNVTRKRRMLDGTGTTRETTIILGLGIDMTTVDDALVDNILARIFYFTPNTTQNNQVSIHNHAIVITTDADFETLIQSLSKGQQLYSSTVADIVESQLPNNVFSMVHLENNTSLVRGMAGVGFLTFADIRS